MPVQVLAVGKKHESWVAEGIARYEKRLRAPWALKWQLVKHSALSEERARVEESDRLLTKLGSDFVILLDERGKQFSSPALSQTLQTAVTKSSRVTVIIGGAWGVDDRVRERANIVWSLSRLVLPHQLVRLVLTEQLYRCQEIARGGAYHHE